MSIFVQPTPAPTPKTKDVRRMALFYAVILVIMAVAQLFTFEEFLKLVTDFGFAGGVRYAHFLAAFLVTAEVLALPFLLRMPLSPAFRWLSLACGWLVALLWLQISLWLVVHEGIVENVGFLGATVSMIPGWWAVSISLVFVILAGWTSWGMWPVKTRSKKGKRAVK